ncbi:polyamine-transporting ATPase 13A2-like isoform X1 [Acipenser ruthenus]|uniref:polyamine-transporting ATPase 13A2-like isoform X1 n=2 Tax=Acipenser ruthenus TaxID=7906 RepID=UPI002740911C|nr:polyamine-transporting ATPase 13A2-like isoform X1 [Acipenser ruthenus]
MSNATLCSGSLFKDKKTTYFKDKDMLLPEQQSQQQPCYGTLQQKKKNTETCMDVCGYQRVLWRVVLCHLFTLLTVGLPLIIFHWRPKLGVQAKCRPCPLYQADCIIIRDSYGQVFAVDVVTEEVDEGSLEQLGAESEEDDWRDTVQLHKEEKRFLRYYVFEGLRYIWMDKKGAFCKVSKLDENWTCGDIYRRRTGLSRQNQSAKQVVYGPNLIDVPVKSYLRLFIDEVLNPFYIFQIFSITLWMFDNYYYYAVCILFISAVSIALSLYETRKQSTTLRNMAQMKIGVTVLRSSGIMESVSSLDLVPGDCLLVPADGLLLPCDAALLAGECMVNEGMLTGESVPVMKTPLPSGSHAAGMQYSPEEHKRHTLFCGTQVIQARSLGNDGVIAVVTRTGFYTAKGDLISSILYPKPISFKFYRDSMKFVGFLGILAGIGTIYSLVTLYRNKAPWKWIIIHALDLITIVVPPALPAAMTAGTIYSQNRLKKHGVFCISPPRINVCGKIKLFCFDKTGTLTEEGLDVWGVVPGTGEGFEALLPEPRKLPQSPVLRVLACCHSVTLLNERLIGDPLDLKMIHSIGWALEEPEGEEAVARAEQEFGMKVVGVMRPPVVEQQPYGISLEEPLGIVRRFPFSSSLQRMSVLVKRPAGGAVEAYLKGSPEMVASLCKKETVPANFTATLKEFTGDGFRVLGLAYKTVKTQSSFEELQELERESVESGMVFLGFLVMRNLLKPETRPVISTLRNANIRTVMVTGDNILTAVNVARNCGMVAPRERLIFVHGSPPSHLSPATLKFLLAESGAGGQDSTEIITQGLYQQGSRFLDQGPYHLALNGKSFAVVCEHFPDILPQILLKGTIFARMAPDQKTQLVQGLQEINYCVGMCGDGANDCGALKAADAGISLSEAEASIASPFTSKIDNIECVPLIIREGRCSLVTSFGLFKYMALYSLIQFVSVLILYSLNTNLGDLQFLFFDLVITTSVAILMGKTGPAKELCAQRPQGSLINISVLGSLLLQTCLSVIIQISTLIITQTQDWFVPLNSTVMFPENLPNYENTGIFCVTGFQYLIVAIVLSKGYPFRKPLYTNVLYLVVLCLLSAVMGWLTLYPVGFMRNVLHLKVVPEMNYKLLLLALSGLNFISALLLETAIDHGMLKCLWRLRGKRQSKKIHKRLEVSLSQQPSWPPLDQVIQAKPYTAIDCS